MTRSYSPRKTAIQRPLRRAPRHAAVHALGFTCFRLVPTSDGLEPIELWQSNARMFAFVGREA
jgi:hypothetical protein